ncbi:MAG: WecB/TagA/CpsF family glycosyltransferase [Firmicutes bacterium]|nr:WecB/TagA/CpsF family glycosyltransferase [Bacillota bacterium]
MDLAPKQELIKLATGWLSRPVGPRQIVTLNALILMRAWQDPAVSRIIQAADMVTVDGAGVELALRKYGYGKIQRLTGLELTLHLLSWCEANGYSVYFYGGLPVVAALLKQMIPARWPGISLCAVRDGFGVQLRPGQVVAEILEKQPGLLLVGLGSPKQELFLAEVLPRLKGTVGVGVGGAFEVLAGIKREAPGFVRDLGVEWLFRMLQDPLRIKKIPDLVKFGYFMLKLK